MNKTESVREGEKLRDLGSLELTKLGSAEVTNFDSVGSDGWMTGEVPKFQTSPLTDSATSKLSNFETVELAIGVYS